MSFPARNFLDLVQDKSGGNQKVPKGKYLESGIFPIVDQGQSDIAGYSDLEESCFKSADLPVIIFGDHTRAVKYVDFPFAMGADGVKVLKPSDECDTRYLYHYLTYADIPSAGYSRHYKFLKELKIPLPSLSEQRRIATILDKADALRQQRSLAIAKLDELLQSVFLDMFGDPVTNPNEYPQIPLGELIKIKSGTGLTAKQMDKDGDYPVYGGNGINGYHNSYMFEEPQLVIGRVGVYCGVVHLTAPNAWVTDNALYIDKYLQPVNQTYLKFALTYANLNQYAGKAAQPLVSGGRIYPVEVVNPPLELQRNFEARVAEISAQDQRATVAAEQLDILFASLQQRAFNGTL